MSPYISYILEFLLNTTHATASEVIKNICYTNDKSKWKNHKVVIVPSGFFDENICGTSVSAPKLPLQSIEGVPLLYGTPEVTKTGDQLIIGADIIASSFFLLSRYEETVNSERDAHGRFQGKSSILYKAGALQRPLVDEYGDLLRGWLRQVGIEVPEYASTFRNVITHDVDQVAQYRSLRGFGGGVLHGHIKDALRSYFGGVEYDPLYTFPWMRSLEKDVDTELFIKVAGKTLPQDIPYFNPRSADVRKLLELYPEPGIHISYEASVNPELIKGEVELLSTITGKEITKSRHHYLTSLKPADYQYLIDAGITDDYTMGYADVAGFRMGTCRPVKWINPVTRQVTDLTLHPLMVMDRTLYDPRYMNLSYDEACELCINLQMQAERFGGEFVTLWHNSTVSVLNQSYARRLFEKVATS